MSPKTSRAMPFYAAAALAVLLAGGGAYSCSKRDNGDRLSDNQVTGTHNSTTVAASTSTPAAPARACGASATYDLLKRELFRRAAQIRASGDPALFDRIASVAALRVERPVMISRDEAVGSTGCTATASLDLPPGLAVAGGRTSLTADLTYALMPAADGSGNVLTFTNADAIVVPLATLGRQGSSSSANQVNPANPTYDGAGEVPPAATGPRPPLPRPSPPPTPVTVNRPVSPPPPPAPPAPRQAPVPTTSANPSFNCASARTRSEISVCGNPGLAVLDRQMAAQFRAAQSAASPEQRAILIRTRSRFLGFRDNCPTEACMAAGYRERMREIDDIMRNPNL